MESIMRMRIRVPAGTMTLCLPCAAEFVVVAGSAEGPAVPDPSPEFGHAMTIPASRAAGQINEFRIRISSSIPLFLDLRALAHNGQRRRSEERRVGKECRSQWWAEY